MIGTRKQWMTFYPRERPVLADFVVDDAPEEKLAEYYRGIYRKSSVAEGGYEAEKFFPDVGEKGAWLFFTASPLRDSEGNITGALETFTRDEARDLVESLGGRTSSDVSKTVDYVVVGKDPGSKYDRAKELGITVLSESQFREMVEQSR